MRYRGEADHNFVTNLTVLTSPQKGGEVCEGGFVVWQLQPLLTASTKRMYLKTFFNGDPWPLQIIRLDLPDVDDTRPARTSCCRRPARYDGGLRLHGHGSRTRSVVLPPHRGSRRCRFVVVWVRRYRCVDCGVACSVLPTGILPRCTYSLASIIAAWLDAVDKPTGNGLGDEEVLARQGLLRCTTRDGLFRLSANEAYGLTGPQLVDEPSSRRRFGLDVGDSGDG